MAEVMLQKCHSGHFGCEPGLCTSMEMAAAEETDPGTHADPGPKVSE